MSKRKADDMSTDSKSDNGLHQFAWRISKPSDMTSASFIQVAKSPLFETVMRFLFDGFVHQVEMTLVDDLKGSHENWHIQGYGKRGMKPKKRLGEMTALAQSTIGPEGYNLGLQFGYFEPCSSFGAECLRTYCMKAESRQAGPFADKDIYDCWDIPKRENFYEFQEQITQDILIHPRHKAEGDRIVNVLYDPFGNSGKSKIGKYMLHFQKQYCFVLPWGKKADLCSLAVRVGIKQSYIIDCTRVKPKDIASDDMYATIEEWKNGYFVNMKGSNTTFESGSPTNIWVFLNMYPNVDSLSRDRWHVWGITRERKLVRYQRDMYKNYNRTNYFVDRVVINNPDNLILDV